MPPKYLLVDNTSYLLDKCKLYITCLVTTTQLVVQLSMPLTCIWTRPLPHTDLMPGIPSHLYLNTQHLGNYFCTTVSSRSMVSSQPCVTVKQKTFKFEVLLPCIAVCT